MIKKKFICRACGTSHTGRFCTNEKCGESRNVFNPKKKVKQVKL